MTPTPPPKVSVCIANYNGVNLLSDCLQSVLAQESDASIEIIVHDDASTDASMELLSGWPGLKVIPSRENVGFCVANNRMAAAASGDYLLLLNNDAALFPDAIATLLREANATPTETILTLPQYNWQSGDLVDRGCLLDPFYYPVPNLDPERREVAYAIGACLFIPRRLWDELSGFPEWFGSIAEDMYLCCAARLRGVGVRCARRSGYRHRQGSSFGGNRVDEGRLETRYARRYLSERNRIIVLVICTPTWLVWPWLLVHIFALSMEGLLVSLARRDFRAWQEIYRSAPLSAWRLRKLTCGQRERVQGVRSSGLSKYLGTWTWSPRKLVLLLRHGLPQIQ